MKELKIQLANALLVVLTVAAIIAAGINLQQQSAFRLPEDGVTWVDRPGGVMALDIVPGQPGRARRPAGGDVLVRINGLKIEKAIDVTQIHVRLGAWRKAEYVIRRAGVEVKVNVILSERNTSPAVLYQYVVGAAYLAIGLFVFFRRGTASKALHFYILCLASFILSHLPLHRQAEQLRQGDLLRQRGRGPVRADHLPALLPDLPGAAALVARRAGGGCCTCRPRCCWRSTAGWHSGTVRIGISLVETALAAGPRLAAVPGAACTWSARWC